MSKSEALTPVIYNVSIADADTEYSQELPKGTKYFSLQCRTAVDMRFAFETGKVATPTAPYATVKASQAYNSPEKLGFSWDTNTGANATIYLAAGSGSLVAELVAWKDIRT